MIEENVARNSGNSLKTRSVAGARRFARELSTKLSTLLVENRRNAGSLLATVYQPPIEYYRPFVPKVRIVRNDRQDLAGSI